MLLFKATNKETKEVIEYEASLPQAEHLTPIWRLEEISEAYASPEVEDNPISSIKFSGRRVLTKLEFRSLFKKETIQLIDWFEVHFEGMPNLSEEQKNEIRTAFVDYHQAEEVNLDDPRWTPGLGLYVALGYMTQEELEEVLRG